MMPLLEHARLLTSCAGYMCVSARVHVLMSCAGTRTSLNDAVGSPFCDAAKEISCSKHTESLLDPGSPVLWSVSLLAVDASQLSS
eukprot:scaffold33593_cov24-Tisochrysis_lutea.AAC.1